jgi:ABC-type glycerol-3-phosphate transport system substrate-binding protein
VRKRSVCIAALAAFILSLFGCSAAEPPVAETDKLVICADAALVTLTRHLGNPIPWQVFHDLYPNVEIELIELPDPAVNRALYETVRQKMRTELMSGKGPDFFVLRSPGRDFEGFFPDVEKAMRSGLFCDLRTLYTDPFSGTVYIDESRDPAAMFTAGQVDGKQFTMPLAFGFPAIATNDITHEKLGVSDSYGTADMLAGLRRVFSAPGAMKMAASGADEIYLNPYNYTQSPLVNYGAETAELDTALTRDILETGKFLSEHIKRLREEGWLRLDRVYTETVNGGFEDYLFSEDYAVMADVNALNWTESRFTSTFYEYSPYLDAIPGEDVGINAMVSYFGAIRANSPNKLNAMRYLALFFERIRLSNHDNMVRRNPPTGAAPITDLASVIAWENFGYLTSRTEETAVQFNRLWSRVVSSRYPVPKEVTDIITRYYEGEIDLDDTIRRMREYWEISLSE